MHKSADYKSYLCVIRSGEPKVIVRINWLLRFTR